MSRDLVRLRNLTQLIEAYNGQQPLQLFLQEQFRLNKSWGSSDRRFYREWIYAYMRLGNITAELTINEAFLLAALRKNEAAIFDAWSKGEESIQKHLASLATTLQHENWFPYQELVSDQIKPDELKAHHESVLPVYARILPKADHGTMNLPEGARLLPDATLSLPAATDLTTWLEKGFLQVQDLGSQMVCKIISGYFSKGLCWDACCGAGGKSLYYASHLEKGCLYCSDIRPGILENLRTRFSAAGIELPFTAVLDLEKAHSLIDFNHEGGTSTQLIPNSVDYLALDVPCSGSGTWGRNPEMLQSRFHKSSPADYAVKQRSILANALPFLKPGALLFYSTCSVYRCENEDNVAYFRDSMNLELLDTHYINGFQNHCDYLYLAVFKKKA